MVDVFPLVLKEYHPGRLHYASLFIFFFFSQKFRCQRLGLIPMSCLSRPLICTEPHVLHIILRVQTNDTSLALHESSRDNFPTSEENKTLWFRVLFLFYDWASGCGSVYLS